MRFLLPLLAGLFAPSLFAANLSFLSPTNDVLPTNLNKLFVSNSVSRTTAAVGTNIATVALEVSGGSKITTTATNVPGLSIRVNPSTVVGTTNAFEVKAQLGDLRFAIDVDEGAFLGYPAWVGSVSDIPSPLATFSTFGHSISSPVLVTQAKTGATTNSVEHRKTNGAAGLVMRADTGNVGIGTNAPAASLHVNGDIALKTENRFISYDTALINQFFGGAGNSGITGELNLVGGYGSLIAATSASNNVGWAISGARVNTEGSYLTYMGVEPLRNFVGVGNKYIDVVASYDGLFNLVDGSRITASGYQVAFSATNIFNSIISGPQAARGMHWISNSIIIGPNSAPLQRSGNFLSIYGESAQPASTNADFQGVLDNVLFWNQNLGTFSINTNGANTNAVATLEIVPKAITSIPLLLDQRASGTNALEVRGFDGAGNVGQFSIGAAGGFHVGGLSQVGASNGVVEGSLAVGTNSTSGGKFSVANGSSVFGGNILFLSAGYEIGTSAGNRPSNIWSAANITAQNNITASGNVSGLNGLFTASVRVAADDEVFGNGRSGISFPSTSLVESRDSGLAARANHGVSNLWASAVVSGTNGVASYATDAFMPIAASGYTNGFAGKNATVYIDGTGVQYVVYNNAGTAVYTNQSLTVNATVNLQPNGKVLIVAGTGVTGTAVPW